MAIPNMDDLEPIEIEALELVPYTTNVQIFSSTPAREIPSKINAVAVDFKAWNNTELGAKGQDYLNDSVGDITGYINTSMGSVVNFINNVVVENQNNFTSDLNSNWETYQNDLNSNLGNYLNDHDAGYSIEQVNSLEFSGETTIEYDVDNNITRITQGVNELFDFVYTDGELTAVKEKITIDGVVTTKSYTITIDDKNNLILNGVV